MEKNEAFSIFAYFGILQDFPDFHEEGQGSLIFLLFLWVSLISERNITAVSEFLAENVVFTLCLLLYLLASCF